LKKKESPYNSQYNAIKRWNDHIFGDIILMTNMQEKRDILCKVFIIGDREDAIKKEEDTRRKMDVRHKNL